MAVSAAPYRLSPFRRLRYQLPKPAKMGGQIFQVVTFLCAIGWIYSSSPKWHSVFDLLLPVWILGSGVSALASVVLASFARKSKTATLMPFALLMMALLEVATLAALILPAMKVAIAIQFLLCPLLSLQLYVVKLQMPLWKVLLTLGCGAALLIGAVPLAVPLFLGRVAADLLPQDFWQATSRKPSKDEMLANAVCPTGGG